MKNNQDETPYTKTLRACIQQAIIRAKQQGTCGMSAACLQQVTNSPNPLIEGAPKGTKRDAAWAYSALFREVLATIPLRDFTVLSD